MQNAIEITSKTDMGCMNNAVLEAFETIEEASKVIQHQNDVSNRH